MAIEFKGSHFERDVILRDVCRHVPLLDKVFLACKRPTDGGWRTDETDLRVKGAWKYPYRAADKAGAMADFLPTDQGGVALPAQGC